MRCFVYYRSDGVIQQVSFSADAAPAAPWPVDGCSVLTLDYAIDGSAFHVVNGALVAGALDVRTLSEHQADKTAELFDAYTSAIAKAVSYSSAGGIAKMYQADPVSRDHVADMLTAFGAAGVPLGFYWVASDNTKVPFTRADLQGLAAAMGAQEFTAFDVFQTLKTSVQVAVDISTVDAVTWPTP